MDVERNFVSLLKAECGAGYTAKVRIMEEWIAFHYCGVDTHKLICQMEGMFQDMDWSRETMALYKQTEYNDTSYGGDKVDMDIQVLTTGYWPVYPQFPNLILPPSLLAPQEHFSEYYKTKYQGRRMTWQYALGHCAVRFKSDIGRTYDLVVSLCQALVLIQFNGDQALKLSQLMAATGLEDRDEMERILQSLSLGKDGTRVLQKLDYDSTPDKKKKTRMNVHDDDTFRVQSNFKSNSRRIRITNILMKETKEERDKTVEAVSLDRLYLIDAVLVRIMKARKTILHQQLIPQVMEQLKVPAQPADIKKRIESLIEREYMERDPKERSRYKYLA
jgi:cullin-4